MSLAAKTFPMICHAPEPARPGEAALVYESFDASGAPSTVYSMSVGDIFLGALDFDGDIDWIAVTLVAGEAYDISLSSGSFDGIQDPYIRIYDSSGAPVGIRDAGIDFETEIMPFTPSSTGTYYISAEDFYLGTGNYELSVTYGTPLPVFTLDQIADQLTNGYWESSLRNERSFDVGPGGTLTVNITDLTAGGQQLARWALEAWSAVSGIQFAEVSFGADITFDDYDDNNGTLDDAYTTATVSGTKIMSSVVNIGTNWITEYGATIDSYSFETYVHEIGHALGLGHAGNYNSVANYGIDNHYLNDSTQATIMSYFNQVQNTYINATYAIDVTPMIADIIAIQNLYGSGVSNNPGNTTYGANSNAGGYLGALFGQITGEDAFDPAIYDGTDGVALTIFDTGGIDTLDLSWVTTNQVINLTPEGISNIAGGIGNLIVARGTVIENAIGGSGADRIIGNSANNAIDGGGASDTFVMAINRSAATVTQTATGYQVVSSLGTDILTGVEFVEFLDQTLDLSTITSGPAVPTPGNDVLFGTSGNDVIDLLAGDDSYDGGAGTDTLIGGSGADTLNGGAGTDTVSYAGEAAGVGVRLDGGANWGAAAGDVITGVENAIGSAYNDTLVGNGVANRLEGGGGDDTAYGQGGDDTLLGGAGADRLYGQGDDDTLIGGSGADTLNGGAGTDTVSYAGEAAGVGVRLDGGANWGAAAGDVITGVENAIGSAYNDTLVGNGVANRLEGGGGDDTAYGQGGDDTLLGGAGADRLYGQGDDDTLIGGSGADTLNGGAGTDTVSYAGEAAGVGVRLDGGANWGAAAGDVITGVENAIGSAYNDTLVGNGVANRLEGGGGDDTAYGQGGDDTLLGGAGADRLYGQGDDDTLIGGSGADTLNGGAGTDTVSYAGEAAGVGVRLDGGANWGAAAGDVITGVENAIGSAYNDTLVGNGVANRLEGGGGDDTAYGQGGDDTLLGGAGADRLYGQGDDDTLIGGSGADTLNGGAGTDTVSYAGEAAGVGVRLDGGANWGAAAGDVITGVENAIGSAYNDTLVGNGVANRLEGGGGADRIYALGGDDTLVGGGGADELYGQGGSDIFVFTDAFGMDTIFGFNAFDTAEKIDLSALTTILSYAALTGNNHMSQQGADVVIDDFAGNTITLKSVQLSDLDSSDFMF